MRMFGVRIRLRERHQVGLILLGSCVVALVVWLGVVRPVGIRRIELTAETQRLAAALGAYENPPSGMGLRERARMIKNGRRADALRWAQASVFVETFKTEADVARFLSEEESDHIDFKVALFDVRRDVSERALKKGVELPEYLGMTDVVDSGKNPRVLMFQLASLEKLIGLLIELKVPVIESLVPLAPVSHLSEGESECYMREYPVEFTIRSDYPRVRKLIALASDARNFFAFRQLAIRKVSMEDPTQVTLRAVASFFVLRHELLAWESKVPEPVEDSEAVEADSESYEAWDMDEMSEESLER